MAIRRWNEDRDGPWPESINTRWEKDSGVTGPRWIRAIDDRGNGQGPIVYGYTDEQGTNFVAVAIREEPAEADPEEEKERERRANRAKLRELMRSGKATLEDIRAALAELL